MAGNNNQRKLSTYSKACLILIGIILVFNLLAWLSTGFCDWYVRKLFPIAVNVIGRFSNLFSFALGDLFLMLTVLLILTALFMLVGSLFFMGRIWKTTKRLWRFIGIYVLVIILELSVNWFVLYHTSSIREQEIPEGREYTGQEVGVLYNYVVDTLNVLVDQVNRDENNIPYCDIDINEEAKNRLLALSELYPKLAGYYPNSKEMGFSGFFSQESVMGYYFPVTMEANINAYMNEINDPVTVCHELTHLKGIIREDEANYIAILACMSSDNAFFRYSGYILAYDYLSGILDTVPTSFTLSTVNPIVTKDDVFLSEEMWEKVEDNAVVPTEIVHDVGTTVIDSSLVLNGVENGIHSYNDVVSLLLHYFLD